MSDTPWTPGPWRVEEGTTLIWGGCDPDDETNWGFGRPLVDAYRPSFTHPNLSDEELDANARLIAQAPALAEALQPFAGCAKDRAALAPEWDGNDTVSIVVTIAELRAALTTLRAIHYPGYEE